MEHPDAMDIVEVPPVVKSEDDVESSRTIAETEMASTAENSASITISAEEQLAKENFFAAVGQETKPIYLTETQFKAGPDFNQVIISRLENVEKQLSIMRAEAEGKAARERAELIGQFERLLEQHEHRMAGRFHESMQARHYEDNELQSSAKTADSEIQNLWMSLDYNIRCMAHEASKHSLKRHDNLSKLLKGALAELCPDVSDIYNNDNAQDGVIQAYIWRQICDVVFFQNCGFWQPHAANDLKSAQINLLSEFLLPAVLWCPNSNS